ncbi:MAG: hypothetical protein JWQ87_4356 [Candidatus Sulfotelmatobacter sp.]|nr:hypothetical protein [Candidatus Sulfotelmatobacter sp.]
MPEIFFTRAKSVGGAVLVGLGIIIFYEHLGVAATQVSHLLGVIPGQRAGMLSLILAATRVLRAYTADHRQFWQGLIQDVLVLSWPLVLVMAGTVLSRNTSDEVDVLAKRNCESVDLAAGCSTSR